MKEAPRRPGPASAAAILLLLAVLLSAGCTEPVVFPPRTLVGTRPEGFMPRPVLSAADAAAYVNAYAQELGVTGVRAERVLDIGGTYWVYASEVDTGRPAFALQVGTDGAIDMKRFPAMEPEMMWNQKYGHNGRPDPATIDERVAPGEARDQVLRALPEGSGLRPGAVSAYYGYSVVSLCEGERLAGEAAVNAVTGEVVWQRFPRAPETVWRAPGVVDAPCD